MTNYAKLPTWADDDHIYAVVETPRGSRGPAKAIKTIKKVAV